MQQSWTLHIEHLGKIENVDLTIAPLMFMLGDNNSGKSYATSVLWGLLTLGKDFFPKHPSDAQRYKRCEQWLMMHQNEPFDMTSSDMQMYVDWFNDLLGGKKKELLARIFNYEIDCGKIELQNYQRRKCLRVVWEQKAVRYRFTSTEKIARVRFPQREAYTREDYLRMNCYICWNLLMDGIAAPLFAFAVKGRRIGEPVYLPASRTGFMLTYSQLLDSSLQASFSNDTENRTTLTLPYIDFLQVITKFGVGASGQKSDPAKESLVSFIESNMMGGRLKVKKGFLPQITYAMKEKGRDFPLYITSSVITESAPLLLLLQSQIDFKTIVIEEPEAHLHPALQRLMARVMIRLMNMGKVVIVTTHSDTIMQHVNNMLKLSRHARKAQIMKQFGYQEDDLLSDDQVAVYQFRKNGQGRTQVGRIFPEKQGFILPTFNDELKKVLDEIYVLEDGDVDE